MDAQPTSKTLGDYIAILVGRTISSFGILIVNFVIIWWITIETTSVFYLSLASLISFLPLVIFLPFAGVFSDILNRKKVLVMISIFHIISTIILIFFLVSVIPKLNILFVFLLINSISGAFYQPTFFAITPSMVSQNNLGRINSLAYLLTSLASLFAPILSGLLISFFPINQLLWVSVIANGIMLFIVLLIKIPQVREIRFKTKDLKVDSYIIQYFKEFIDGFSTFITIPSILILLGAFIILDFFTFPISSLFSYFIIFMHNVTVFEYATVSFFVPLGMIIVIITCIIKKYWNPVILLFFLSISLIFLGNLVIIFAPYRSFFLISITLSIKGMFLVFINILFPTFIQSNVPNNKLGRVSAIYFSIASLIAPFASFLLTIILFLFSDVTMVLLLSTIGGMISIILIYMFTGIRKIKVENYKIIDNFEEYNHN